MYKLWKQKNPSGEKISDRGLKDTSKAFTFDSPTSDAVSDKDSDMIGKITGIGGLAPSLIGVGLIPLVVFPLIDYSAYIDGNSIVMDIKNIGLTSAKNVIISVHADGADFSDLRTEPYLSEQFKKDVNSSGDVYGKITDLPPQGEVKVTGILDTTKTKGDAVITPYIFSDETVGKINRIWTLVFYTILAILYTILFIHLWFGVKITLAHRWDVLLCYICLGAYIGCFFMIYELLAIIPTYPKSTPSLAF